jgi:hypothetical protein
MQSYNLIAFFYALGKENIIIKIQNFKRLQVTEVSMEIFFFCKHKYLKSKYLLFLLSFIVIDYLKLTMWLDFLTAHINYKAHMSESLS